MPGQLGVCLGAFLARQILEAADRGVKVRLLVDDLDARARNTGFAALAAHPNIDVRLFNPFASRKGGLQLASEGARDFKRINRRELLLPAVEPKLASVVRGGNRGGISDVDSREPAR